MKYKIEFEVKETEGGFFNIYHERTGISIISGITEGEAVYSFIGELKEYIEDCAEDGGIENCLPDFLLQNETMKETLANSAKFQALIKEGKFKLESPIGSEVIWTQEEEDRLNAAWAYIAEKENKTAEALS